jgi:hypothetical protein
MPTLANISKITINDKKTTEKIAIPAPIYFFVWLFSTGFWVRLTSMPAAEVASRTDCLATFQRQEAIEIPADELWVSSPAIRFAVRGFEIYRRHDAVYAELNQVARLEFGSLNPAAVQKSAVGALIVNQIKTVGFGFDVGVLFRGSSFSQRIETDGAIFAAPDSQKAFGQIVVSARQRSALDGQT